MKPVHCPCSRCKLYLKVTTDLGDLDYESELKLKNCIFEERKYQTALIEYGKKKNIMSCLPTGSGKTFIALKLIDYYKADIVSDNKKVFFLANTIPLVNQQAAFIARNSSVKVRHLTGDMDVDYWSEEKWKQLIEEFNVMAMTSMIFLNMLRHGYIKFSQIALLVFDECHHCIGNHPFGEIMKEYARAKPEYLMQNCELPRILGLSATIIKGNCKPHEVPTKIRELERVMQSVALTYKDYEEVLANSTCSKIEEVSFSTSNEWAAFYKVAEMKQLSEQLQTLRKERKLAKLGAAKLTPSQLDPKMKTFDNVYNLLLKKPSPGDLKIALDDVLHAYKELGLYCTKIAINLRLAFIEFSLMDINDGTVKNWYIKIKEYLLKLRNEIVEEMARNESDETKYVTRFVTPKVQTMLNKLENYRKFEKGPICQFDEDDRLCGLIFVDRRATAQVLAWYLKDLAKYSKEFEFLRPHFVVGTSRSAFESVESRVYARKQTEALNEFRTKKLNLLIATSVLEEGIDVPSCNLVLRFDEIKTYTSYIQSMGRARRRGAKFYALLPEDDFYKLVQRLKTFQEINQKIIDYLKANVEKIDADNNNIPSPWESDLIPPICPGGTADSPKITMDSCGELIEKYCMLLPCDGISSLFNLSWWTECEFATYQASLKLPLNSVLKGTIVGIPARSKELARQTANMEAARQLLEAGVLDERLLPFHPIFPLKVQKFFGDLVPLMGNEDGDNQVVDNTPTPVQNADANKSEAFIHHCEWYSKREPKCLRDNPPRPHEKFYIYKLNFELVTERENCPWENLYKLQNATEGFGIITSNQEFPNIEVFPLFGIFGTINVSLSQVLVKAKNIQNEAFFKKFKDVQNKLFSDILGLKHSLFGNSEYPSILIVPLIKVKDEWKIHERITEDLGQFESMERMKRPRQQKEQSIPRVQPHSSSSLNKFRNAIVFPWYKGKNKPAYLVDSISENMTPLSKINDGEETYKSFIESQYKGVRIRDNNQPLLKCKFAGTMLGRLEKDPIQLNYLLEKYKKEDESPLYLVPELCFSVSVPATFMVQLKLLPSALHRISRLLLAKEILLDCSQTVGWPAIRRDVVLPDADELLLMSNAHEVKKKEEAERRKRRLEMREETLRSKKRKPLASNKQHIEERELHYEFIHPNNITLTDIKLFHEAVSTQHSAKKLTHESTEVEKVDSNLSLKSEFSLADIKDLDLVPIEKPLSEMDFGPSLLSVLQALSTRNSNEGVAIGRLQCIGSSFMTFAVSAFAYFNFPNFEEPVLCQLRNRLLSLQVLHRIGQLVGLPEMLSGSNFYPDASCWVPPGKEIQPAFLGDLAASNKLHLNIFDELLTINPVTRKTQLSQMTRKALEEFINQKALTAGIVGASSVSTENSTASATNLAAAPSSSSSSIAAPERRSIPNKKKPSGFTIKHSTFTHTELADFDVANGINSLVGAFFKSSSSAGAYKALEWLGFKAPDSEGIGRALNDWTRAPANNTIRPSQSTASILFPQFASLEKAIQYEFNDKNLLVQAFAHATYPAHNLNACYQRLEFLGDSILDFLLTNHIYSQLIGDDHAPEDLANIRSALVNCITYASLAVRNGFQKYLLSMSKPLTDMIDNFVVYQESVEHHVVGHFTLISDEDCIGGKHIEVPKVLSDIWESLAGAIYIDSGNSLDAVWRVFYRLMQYEIDFFWEKKPQPPLYELQSLMKKEEIEVKFRRNTGKKTQARGREIVRCEVGAYGNYFGVGTNKQRAKEAAAKIALKLIKEETDFIKNRDASKIMLLCP